VIQSNIFCKLIELFNTHNFIVVFDEQYKGPQLSESYIFDLDKQAEIEREVDIFLTKEKLNKTPHRTGKETFPLYKERLLKLGALRGFEIVNIEE